MKKNDENILNNDEQEINNQDPIEQTPNDNNLKEKTEKKIFFKKNIKFKK